MQKAIFSKVMVGLGLAASILLASPLAPTQASAHSWYDQDCCGEQDCERVAIQRINFLADGNMIMKDAKGTDWLINVRELRSRIWGEYPKTWDDESAVLDSWMPYRDTDEIPPGAIKRASQDGEYHLCVYRGQVQCVYFPADR